MAEARQYWSNALGRGMLLEVGDGEIETAYREALVILLGCTERHGVRLIPIGNPFQYRDVWLRDGARCAAALAMAGQSETARSLVAGFLDYQWPQGPFLSQRGQPDGTGETLWAFGQVLLRPSPDSAVARYANAALTAWRWCESQRVSTRILGLPFGGLMAYCEPHDCELPHGHAQVVGTDAWAIAGYTAAARLLEAAGREVDARDVRRARNSYEALFQSTLARLPCRDIPPTWQGVGRDWGNLSVVYPCGALPANHPRARAVADRVWSRLPGPGLVHYGDSLHTYLSADLANSALLDGRREEADAVLSALLRWRTASGGSPEIFDSARRDYGNNLPPHGTAAAAIVTLIRNAIVFDDDDTLRLTLGARPQWWVNGRVRRAPTRWGLLDLEFSSRDQIAEWKWTSVPVPTTVTLPPGARAAEPLDDPALRLLGPDLVLVPPHVGQVRVRLKVAKDGLR